MDIHEIAAGSAFNRSAHVLPSLLSLPPLSHLTPRIGRARTQAR